MGIGLSLGILRSLLVILPLVSAGCSVGEGVTDHSESSAATTTLASVAPANDSRPRIVFLGDSLTAGFGLPREHALPSLIQARLDAEGYQYTVINAGVSGDTSAGGLRRLDWALEGDVKILVIELGGNDGLRGLPVAQMKSNLRKIIEHAERRDLTVILAGMEAPPNYGAAYTSEFRNAFRDLADEYAVIFVPFLLDGVAGIPHLNIADGIHPNAEGAKRIEQTIWRALQPALKERR